MSEFSENSIFSPIDFEILSGKNLIGSITADGTRLVHKRRLNRSSDEEHAHIPIDISPESPEAAEAFAMIPDKLISLPTLLYVGFSGEHAAETWHRWQNWSPGTTRRETDPDDGEGLIMSFNDFFTGAIDTVLDDAEGDDDDEEWRRCMSVYGLSSDTQDAIMDAEFKDLRKSETSAFWAKDTVEMRYAGLQEIQETSHERAMALRRATLRPGPSDSRPDVSVSPYPAQGASSSTQSRRSISGMQKANTPGVSLDSSSSARANASYNAPGRTTLFKGVDQARIRGLLDHSGQLASIDRLLSQPPSDFSGTRALYYLTANLDVAKHYAGYAKRRAESESIVIVCISIPNQAVESLQEPDVLHVYWPSPEWKKLIWTSRNGGRLGKELSKYNKATLIIGSISRRPSSHDHQLSSWEDITERELLMIDGSRVTQHVFSAEEGAEFLEEHIEAGGISIFPFKD